MPISASPGRTAKQYPRRSSWLPASAGSWQPTQDEAGVYIIARRKPLVGSIGRCKFDISLPADVHISLKLEHCLLCLQDLSATLDFPRFP